MKLAIVTPTRDGLVDINYATSVIGLIKVLDLWEVEPTMISGASDITAARNALFNTWYYSTDVEVFMFVDSDISFDPKAIAPWLDMEVECISATYPKKFFNHNAFLHVASLFQQEKGEINVHPSDPCTSTTTDQTPATHMISKLPCARVPQRWYVVSRTSGIVSLGASSGASASMQVLKLSTKEVMPMLQVSENGQTVASGLNRNTR